VNIGALIFLPLIVSGQGINIPVVIIRNFANLEELKIPG
jgi:hypothetical protein